MNHIDTIKNINAARNINKDGTPKLPAQTFLGDTATPVGASTTKGHSASQGGLRGHSIGTAYPYSVVLRLEGDIKAYDVVNLLTGGAPLHTFTGTSGSAKAHALAESLGKMKRGEA